ncbi:MAG: glucokinase [Cyanobacteriota bacterium]|nr:glucokinase [Cyanobacteriota bacterium]
MTTLLAGDIGGTKTLLSLYRLGSDSRLDVLLEKRLNSADWPDLAPMVRSFLSAAAAQGHTEQPAAACLAVAGPVQAGRAQLTNLPWQLEERQLASATGIPLVELVNDFAVLIYGLPHLEPDQQALIRPGQAQSGEPLLVVGAGTGLGVAYGVPTASGLRAVASEGGHAEFAAASEEEWHLRQWLLQDLDLQRLSIERVVSGTGLGHVMRWLLASHHPDGDHPLARGAADLPAATAAAAAAGEPLARHALDLWLGAYGRVCGDLALAGLCRGGIWLAGGTASKLLAELRSQQFLQAFLAKGRLQAALDTIPVQAVTDPAIGPFSAACRARMLVA